MLRVIEKPRGCLRILKLMTEKETIYVSQIIHEGGLSQDNTYSSLEHLRVLGLVTGPSPCHFSNRRRTYTTTRRARDLMKLLRVFFDLAKLVHGKENIAPLLSLPIGSLELLVRFRKEGRITLTSLLRTGICRYTAMATLESLQELRLVRVDESRHMKDRTRILELTPKGKNLSGALELVDDELNRILIFQVPFFPGDQRGKMAS